MRIVGGLALALMTSTGALAADLDYRPYRTSEDFFTDEVIETYAPSRVIEIEERYCVRCPSARLPFGGLRRTYEAQLPYGGLRRTYQASLPYGGLRRYCPPPVRIRNVVLVRKG